MHRLGIILLSAVVAFGALRQSISAQTSPDKITLGTITLSLNNLPIYVAQDKGFFAKENLFVEAVVLNASTRAIPALIGGSTQISASSAMTTIRAVEKGANLKNRRRPDQRAGLRSLRAGEIQIDQRVKRHDDRRDGPDYQRYRANEGDAQG